MFRIRSPQDFGAAAVFVAIGVAGLYFASDLAFGTASRMGPGYFPVLLSACILLIGVIVGIRSLSIDGPAVERIAIRPIAVIVLCIVGFGLTIERAGVAITAAALVLLASYARPGARLPESLALAAAMVVFVIAVFVYALGQPLPVLWSR
jgi:Tripartite tricarboxylate transporter TctB family